MLLEQSITACSNLQTLYLRDIKVFRAGSSAPLIRQWIPSILEAVSSRTLQEVKFDILFGENSDLRSFEWNEVTEVLSRPQFEDLRKIVLRLGGSHADRYDLDCSPSLRFLEVPGFELPSISQFERLQVEMIYVRPIETTR